ncbi:hypothetical protein D9757_001913 [Collybiopsis confluens]|uniref:Uncharacterized protein n=1 Tax=Collybiopsis confluens TaxID=2823264 RepID=A0A8H5MF32_9AGAR|nr:hypothetical protein D9757_001913 [Collybiopsis confluens]
MSFLRSLTGCGSAPRLTRLFSLSFSARSNAAWTGFDDVNKQLHKTLTDERYVAAKGPTDFDLPEKKWLEQSKLITANYANLSYLNNNPYYGRSVDVVDGDVGKAFKRLDSILTRNMVRRELRLTERHEKKGPKRRRLESERWRRLFAHEVRKSVQLVTKIRKRGA